jgi:hypothetical protein
MNKKMIDPNIKNEETRTLKWFLVLFYIISIAFDIIFTFISKNNTHLRGATNSPIYWIYL